jgi:hypothetical protein
MKPTVCEAAEKLGLPPTQLFRLTDVLQLTGWVRVVVGTSFSFHDVLMYAAGCGVVYWLDVQGD